MVYIFVGSKKFQKQIKYIFNYFMDSLKIEYSFIEEPYNSNVCMDFFIAYSDLQDIPSEFINVKNKIVIIPSNKLFGENYLKESSLPKTVEKIKVDSKRYFIEDLISIYKNDNDLFIEEDATNKCIKTNLDIISNSFFMLSRYEEIVQSSNINCFDSHKRFCAKNSIAYINGFLDRPIVNEYINLVKIFFEFLNYKIENIKYDGKYDFLACLTHDIDGVQKYYNFNNCIRSTGSWLIRNRDFIKAIGEITEYIKGKKDYSKDAFWTFKYMVNCENNYGFTSSFYFMTNGKSRYDNKYDISEERIKNIFKYLNINNREIGLHSGYDTYDNDINLKEQKKYLDNFAPDLNYGARQHFLRFKSPYTWELYEKLSIKYDTSLGYADNVGFRAGTCIPFKPYDIINDEVLNVWEIPLIVMDVSLKNKDYCNYNPEEAFIKIKELIDRVKKYHGIFTVLWHNSSFDISWLEWRNLYDRSLKYIYTNNGLGLSGIQVLKYFE